MQNAFPNYPVAAPIPNSVHAVSSSLPTMDSVIGYEEKRPDVMDLLKQGYPRFLQHYYIEKVIDVLRVKHGIDSTILLPVCSNLAADKLLEYTGINGKIIAESGFVLVTADADEDACAKASAFLQHTGFALSSRQAEDFLIDCGDLDTRQEEERVKENPEDEIQCVLAELCPNAKRTWLARSGMSAGYAALIAAAQVQAKRGRTLWVQLGWLYLDTQSVGAGRPVPAGRRGASPAILPGGSAAGAAVPRLPVPGPAGKTTGCRQGRGTDRRLPHPRRRPCPRCRGGSRLRPGARQVELCPGSFGAADSRRRRQRLVLHPG